MTKKVILALLVAMTLCLACNSVSAEGPDPRGCTTPDCMFQ